MPRFVTEVMKWLLKTKTGELIELDVELSETIGDVKVKVQFQKGIRIEQQRFICAGKVLQNDCILGSISSNLVNGDVLLVSKPDVSVAVVKSEPEQHAATTKVAQEQHGDALKVDQEHSAATVTHAQEQLATTAKIAQDQHAVKAKVKQESETHSEQTELERKEAANVAAKAAARKKWGVELSAKDRQRLERALKGNIFGFANPTNTMLKMGLTPLHMPFGSDMTIIDFARAAGLKSV